MYKSMMFVIFLLLPITIFAQHRCNFAPQENITLHNDDPLQNIHSYYNQSGIKNHCSSTAHCNEHSGYHSTSLYNQSKSNLLLKNSSESWVSLGPEGGDIISFVISPDNSDIFYALTYGMPSKIYKSTNGCETWQLISSIPAKLVRIIIDPNNSSVIYVTNGIELYKSIDSAVNWQRYEITSERLRIADMAISPQDSNVLYVCGAVNVGTYEDPESQVLLYKSSDGGISWTRNLVFENNSNSLDASFLSMDPNTPNTLYTGGDYWTGSGFAGFLLKTTDSGNSWSNIENGISRSPYHLAVDPTNSEVLYASTYQNVYRSENGGTTWQINNGQIEANRLAIDPNNPGNIYACANSSVYKSTDSGRNWRRYRDTITGWCHNILIDPTVGNKVYVGSQIGVFKSEDSGIHWNKKPSGMIATTISAIAISPSNPGTVYFESFFDGIHNSADNCSNFDKVMEFTGCGNIAALAVDPTTPEIVYALEGSG